MFDYLLEKRYSDDPDRKAKALELYRKNEELAKKVREVDEGQTTVISGLQGITLDRRINEFDEVSVMLQGDKRKIVTFTVNGEYDYGSIEDPKDRVKAVLAVRSMFHTLTKAMQPGQEINCDAYEEDGRGSQRQKAYERIGFFTQKDGSLKGIVKEGGGVSPAYAYNETASGSLKDWYMALFGELPRRGPSKAP